MQGTKRNLKRTEKQLEEELTSDCVLCGLKIPPEYDPKTGKPFWWGGHNPHPVSKKGRCCDVCNHTKVIPARLRLIETHGGE